MKSNRKNKKEPNENARLQLSLFKRVPFGCPSRSSSGGTERWSVTPPHTPRRPPRACGGAELQAGGSGVIQLFLPEGHEPLFTAGGSVLSEEGGVLCSILPTSAFCSRWSVRQAPGGTGSARSATCEGLILPAQGRPVNKGCLESGGRRGGYTRRVFLAL